MNRNQPLDKRVESVLGRRNRNANLLSGKEVFSEQERLLGLFKEGVIFFKNIDIKVSST